GALAAILPSLWGGWLGGALAYRPLFALVGVSAAANLLLLSQAREHRPKPAADPQGPQHEGQIRHQENRILERLVLINALNGLAVGLSGPLISYWFMLRFQVGPAYIAPVMAATFLLTGVASLVTGRLTERIGIVRSVIGERLIGLLLLTETSRSRTP
ncbi:MAG: MFS transporter, partial [Anaerolineae bacterium]